MLRTTFVFALSAVLVLLNLHTLARVQSFATSVGHPLGVAAQVVFIAAVLLAAAAFGVSTARHASAPPSRPRPQDLVLSL